MRAPTLLFVASLLLAACSSNGNGGGNFGGSCDSACAHAGAAGCTQFSSADCLGSCQKEQARAGAPCASQWDAYISCVGSAAITCDKHGEPDVGSACDATESAYKQCVSASTDSGPPACAPLRVPPTASTCSAAPPTPGTACTKKCDACNAPPGVLSGPCVCDGTRWVCQSDVATGGACGPVCP